MITVRSSAFAPDSREGPNELMKALQATAGGQTQVSLRTLSNNFALIADAPNGVAELRELISQLAPQGRLVLQDPTDEPASVLLEKIKGDL